MPLAQGIPTPPTPEVLPPTPILIENPAISAVFHHPIITNKATASHSKHKHY